MRVCMILEGCYPFVRGGVSTWVHQYLTHSPEIEFVLWTIHATREDTITPLYQLPSNVKEHHMVILDEVTNNKIHCATNHANEEKFAKAVYYIIQDQNNRFDDLAKLLRSVRESPAQFLHAEAFLKAAQKLSDETPGLGLSDAFYGLQSMFMPICKVITAKIPRADIYHSAVAGYGGLLGAIAAIETNKPFVLTEHGIYPREREEELLSSDWTVPAMRPLWINLFYEMSKFAYNRAVKVTSLFEDAKARQITIGCNPSKCVVIPNGILIENFDALKYPKKCEEIHIGAFVRFAAIKDLKTLIHAFHTARQTRPNIILHIMGGTDDQSYRNSCESLIERLGMRSYIKIEGHIHPTEYMEKMHLTILTSISEGQPLTILESMASGRPCIATRVGDCAGLIEKPIDGIGPSGICCAPMAPDEIANAIVKICSDEALRCRMGANGKMRVKKKYLLQDMLKSYHAVYQEVI